MLKLDNPEYKDIFETIYDPRLFQLNAELSKVDELLEDPELLTPFRERFAKKRGRPTVPLTTYLRLMYLKDRYQLGYETLVEEVSDHTKWRKFCRISLDKRVPDATTLIKLTQKYGPDMIQAVNNQLLRQLKNKGILKGKALRLDTTVVQANIHYPTDAGLLADSINKITHIVKRIKKQKIVLKTRFRDRTRTVKKTILRLCKGLRRKVVSQKENIKEQTGKLLAVTRTVINQARKITRDNTGNICDQARHLFSQLNRWTDVAERIHKQTKQVLAGKDPNIPSRLVSIFDTTARPIKKGKLGVKAEFGNKILVQDTTQGIITGYQVLEENPHDTRLLDDALTRHEALFHKPPGELAADRGFSSRENEANLEKKIKHISIPRRGRLSQERKQYQRQHWFRRLQRFRAGGEAKISLLKRKFGLRRSRLRHISGMAIHVGWGILAHNLWQTARIS